VVGASFHIFPIPSSRHYITDAVGRMSVTIPRNKETVTLTIHLKNTALTHGVWDFNSASYLKFPRKFYSQYINLCWFTVNKDTIFCFSTVTGHRPNKSWETQGGQLLLLHWIMCCLILFIHHQCVCGGCVCIWTVSED
jgi:hypothetical protein